MLNVHQRADGSTESIDQTIKYLDGNDYFFSVLDQKIKENRSKNLSVNR